MTDEISLKRSISLPLLTLYGLGTIIGAGIYVLVGEVAQLAGLYAPVSFIVAAVIAGFTAFTYAELSSRYPKSAGEAYYSGKAFRRPWLAALLGWAVILIGIVSAATMVNGFVGYFQYFVDLPDWLIICVLILCMGLLAAWGISETVWMAALITLVEIGGLIFVIVISGESALHSDVSVANLVPPIDGAVWGGIFLGSFLAFYAFIGFEDMVNIAEEVKEPSRNLPISIILALVISTVLYVVISLIAITVMPVEQLGASSAPLKDIVAQTSDKGAALISVVSLVAVINGALIQLILASRVLYGMARQNIGPAIFARVHPRTRTPLWSTGVAVLMILLLALGFSLVWLAKLTSFITLLVFAAMHLSLIVVKQREQVPAGAVIYPTWLPVIGLILTLALIVFQMIQVVK
jgi:APA family basic amino acid/polyamine antiporter